MKEFINRRGAETQRKQTPRLSVSAVNKAKQNKKGCPPNEHPFVAATTGTSRLHL